MATCHSDDEGDVLKPRGISIRKGEEGVVADVLVTVNPDGSKTVKIKIRQERRPEVGDKFASSPAQKGVIGLILNQEDMPFTSEGICPDILINACSEASRSTTGRIKEIRSGKYAALNGKMVDATIFNSGGKKEMDEMGESLHKLGYNKYGWERMTNGTTGEMMEALIYTGVCYYQRLKHMVADKIHVRGYKGPIASLTRQPLDGRNREGGLRFGEMERDNLISLGVGYTLQEILLYFSDYYQTVVCNKCGMVAIGDRKKMRWLCRACKKNDVSLVEMPYILHLLQAELAAAHIALRLILE
jgi:DNA-directed RNA polymerase beta subunit